MSTLPYPKTDFQKLRHLYHGIPIRFPDFPRDGRESPEAHRTRTIKASLLKFVIREYTDGVSVPIRIENAVIEGDLDVKYVVFKEEVSITYSIFTDRADFSFADFRRAASFDDSQFITEADFRAAHAAYDFRIPRTRFAGKATFTDMKVDEVFRAEGAYFRDVSFVRAKFAKAALFCPRDPGAPSGQARRVRFMGDADFEDAHMQGVAHFEGVKFSKKAKFVRTRFDSSVLFQCYEDMQQPTRRRQFIHTIFKGEAHFRAARVAGSAYFDGAQFRGKADFERAQITGHGIFRTFERGGNQPPVPLRFGGEVNFLAAEIGGNAEFYGVQFRKDAYFERLVVSHNAAFNSFHDFGDEDAPRDAGPLIRTEFHGLADFLGCHIKGAAEFVGVIFMGRAWFESVQVEGNAYFDDIYVRKVGSYDEDAPEQPPSVRDPVGPVQFYGNADFINSRFMRQAVFRRVRFKKKANFTNAEVHGKAVFEQAVFAREVKFTSAAFKNQADFNGARFGSKADFTDFEIDGAAFFQQATFAGPVVLHSARFKSLDLKDARFVSRQFVLRRLPEGVMRHLPERVRRGLLRAFPELLPGRRRWVWVRQQTKGNMDMRGFTYEHIKADHVHVLDCLDPYDRQPYTILEKAFRATGENREADQIFFEAICREGQVLRDRALLNDGAWWKLSWERVGNFIRALWNLAQGVFFRHGVRPLRLFFYCLAALLVGFGVFSQDGALDRRRGSEMVSTGQSAPAATPGASPTPTQVPTKKDAINVSLRQFIPIIDIPAGSEWVPTNRAVVVPMLDSKLCVRGRCFTVAGYAAVHKLVGFLMIPVGVAALAGLLHRRDKGGK